MDVLEIAKRALTYLFQEVYFEYDRLTDTEKKLYTREEFEALVNWVRGD